MIYLTQEEKRNISIKWHSPMQILKVKSEMAFKVENWTQTGHVGKRSKHFAIQSVGRWQDSFRQVH